MFTQSLNLVSTLVRSSRSQFRVASTVQPLSPENLLFLGKQSKIGGMGVDRLLNPVSPPPHRDLVLDYLDYVSPFSPMRSNFHPIPSSFLGVPFHQFDGETPTALNRRMNQMGGSSLFSTSSSSSSSSSSSTRKSDSAKSEWQELMAVYKNHMGVNIPWDLESATKEEMHLQELSAATAYHLDKDGHRCDGAPDSVLQVVELPHPLETLSLHSNSLFVRDFYPRLVQRIFLDSKHKRCVLIGNPGISKSFFHWYFFLFFIFLQYTYWFLHHFAQVYIVYFLQSSTC